MANWLARAHATLTGAATDDVRKHLHRRSITEAANDEATRRWRVYFPNLDPVEVLFAPAATRANVAAFYPGARIEPLPEPFRRTATRAEADELRTLVRATLADAPQEWDEATAAALADPEAALTSLRALMADMEPAPIAGSPYAAAPLAERDPGDDRRTCVDCANLTAGEHRCLAASRGERPGNSARDHHPIVDLLRRCERYQPLGAESDQRSGAQRWPCLVEPRPSCKRPQQ